jgi:hypothetical protein
VLGLKLRGFTQGSVVERGDEFLTLDKEGPRHDIYRSGRHLADSHYRSHHNWLREFVMIIMEICKCETRGSTKRTPIYFA